MMSLQQNSEAQSLLARDQKSLLPVYPRYQVVMERGEGIQMWDTSGNRYQDWMTGLGVSALGHCHPRMVAAMQHQATQMVHLSPQYAGAHAVDLAERLCALTGLASVFFSTGGTEAVEGALKLARAYGNKNFGPHKNRIVSLNASYHGRTYGALSVTGQEKYRSDFDPGLPCVDFVDRENLKQLEAAVNGDTCCIILEPILGEGGVFDLSDAYMRGAREIANRHSALLIFDEIQVGLGRTGDWFACQKSGVKPDAIILGKPLGGGLPLSALVVDKDLVHVLGISKHGSTLGGSPMACRMGLEFFAIMEEEKLLDRVKQTGAYLGQKLQVLASRHSIAVEARGRGLIHGLELSVPARPIAEKALSEGMMINVVQGNVLRFLPSFLMEPKNVDEMIAVLDPILAAVSEPTAAPVASGVSR